MQLFIQSVRLTFNMKRISLLILSLFCIFLANAQKVDSIFFHLYTDSLKKGTHNYINVDGKLSNSRWLPLTEKEIKFSCSYGKFSGNELVLPANPSEEKVLIRAELKTNPQIWKEITVWIKKIPDNERLPSKDDVLDPRDRPKNKKKD